MVHYLDLVVDQGLEVIEVPLLIPSHLHFRTQQLSIFCTHWNLSLLRTPIQLQSITYLSTLLLTSSCCLLMAMAFSPAGLSASCTGCKLLFDTDYQCSITLFTLFLQDFCLVPQVHRSEQNALAAWHGHFFR